MDTSILGSRLEGALTDHSFPVFTLALSRSDQQQLGNYILRKVLHVEVPENMIERRKWEDAAITAADAVQCAGDNPFFEREAVRREFWRIIGAPPSDAMIQNRRARQQRHAKTKRATAPKPETLLTPMETYALLVLPTSPLSKREKIALEQARQGEPAFGEDEKKARTRMRVKIKDTSPEVLNMLVDEVTDQLDRIEGNQERLLAMVESLYQLGVVAPLEDEVDAILARADDERRAVVELAHMSVAPDAADEGFIVF